MCVYGWTRNILIEYYIVDILGAWRPPDSMGTIYIDDGVYDIYITDRINQPSIDGTANFKQCWSVRTEKKASGTISVSKHFEEWTKKGVNLGLIYETSLTIEGYQSQGSAFVNQNDIVGG